MISIQETLNLSPYMAIYDIVVPKDNMLRQINELGKNKRISPLVLSKFNFFHHLSPTSIGVR
ncbi:hypothetical protein ACQKNC_05410 [Lysinibacillus sp. NPDC094177]|uniref:hypothetical protein n=1 Tax=Lysinibacillus sp. NPDC094177 TaxID=3390580 RepID=UPI003D08F876